VKGLFVAGEAPELVRRFDEKARGIGCTQGVPVFASTPSSRRAMPLARWWCS